MLLSVAILFTGGKLMKLGKDLLLHQYVRVIYRVRNADQMLQPMRHRALALEQKIAIFG